MSVSTDSVHCVISFSLNKKVAYFSERFKAAKMSNSTEIGHVKSGVKSPNAPQR